MFPLEPWMHYTQLYALIRFTGEVAKHTLFFVCSFLQVPHPQFWQPRKPRVHYVVSQPTLA